MQLLQILEKIREQNYNSMLNKQQLDVLSQGTQIIQNMGGVDSYGSELLSRFGIN